MRKTLHEMTELVDALGILAERFDYKLARWSTRKLFNILTHVGKTDEEVEAEIDRHLVDLCNICCTYHCGMCYCRTGHICALSTFVAETKEKLKRKEE